MNYHRVPTPPGLEEFLNFVSVTAFLTFYTSSSISAAELIILVFSSKCFRLYTNNSVNCCIHCLSGILFMRMFSLCSCTLIVFQCLEDLCIFLRSYICLQLPGFSSTVLLVQPFCIQ